MTAAPTATPTDKPNWQSNGFKPGQSGRDRRSKRYIELHSALSHELGGDLTAIEQALLSQACTVLCRAERPGTDPNDVVRLTNAGARLLTTLLNRRKQLAAAAELPATLDEFLDNE